MLASELAGPAEITRLELLGASAEYDSGVYQNFRLFLCPTTQAELSNNYEANYDGNQPMLVRSEDRLEVFWTEGAWDGFEFDSAFAYDGTSNLLVEFRWQGSDGRAVYTRGWYPTGGNRTLDGYSLTSPTGALRPYCVCLRIHYLPTGVKEETESPLSAAMPTHSVGRLVVTGSETARLHDACGRLAARLRPGVNDLSRLPPGVYFISAGAARRRIILR